MNNKEHIEQLKKLQITDENEHATFSNYRLLRLWIDNVAPLLKYSNEHYFSFMNAANMCLPGISSRTAMPCLNNMKSIVNRAIIELENGIMSPKENKKEESIYPDKKTVGQITDHTQNRVLNMKRNKNLYD